MRYLLAPFLVLGTCGAASDGSYNYVTSYNYVNSTHNDIPTLPAACTVEIIYGQRRITSLGALSNIFGLNHGGLTFLPLGGCAGDLDSLSFEYWGLHFPLGVLFPTSVTPGKLPTWDAGSVITWEKCRSAIEPLANGSKTEGNCTATPWAYEVAMGTMTGAQFNAFAKWVPKYLRQHSNYELWDVWSGLKLDDSKGTTVFSEGSTCVSFAEAGLVAAHERGGNMSSPTPRDGLKRNFAPLIAKAAPRQVNVSEPAELAELNKFYAALVEIEDRVLGNGGGIADFLKALYEVLESHVFFVYTNVPEQYLRIDLDDEPLAAAVHLDLMQVMRLPWLQ